MNQLQIQQFSIGIGFTIIVVKLLKKLLRMPRPVMTDKKTFGMPSTRAATLVYIMTYILSTHKTTPQTKQIFASVILFCISLKYIMKEHSLSQLTIGGILGFTFAQLFLRE